MRDSSDAGDTPVTLNHLTERIAGQQWPTHTLYVVATPIGNLGDLTLRARHALALCDVIAAEDTRSSRALLDAWGIQTPLVAAHRHNEAHMAQALIARLQQGERVALISDAGAPGVSDPGARIVRAVRQAGLGVVPLPGASAVVTALMASGITSDENPAFIFAGFVPPKAVARRTWLQRWCALPAPVVMYESPHRLAATLSDLVAVCGADRHVTLARELTKRFEQVHTATAHELVAWLAEDTHRSQGEFVLMVHEVSQAVDNADVAPDTLVLLDALLDTVSVRDAARIAAKVTGLPRDTLYALALERQKTS